MSPLALVELDKLARLCKASSILSFTVVGLEATISSYSDISATDCKVYVKYWFKDCCKRCMGASQSISASIGKRTYKRHDKVRTF